MTNSKSGALQEAFPSEESPAEALTTLRQKIIVACRDMDEEYREIEREFLTADEELHRAVDRGAG